MRRLALAMVCLASSTSVALADEPLPKTSGLRNGFSLSAGQEFGGNTNVSATMFGVDWRIGWRFTEAVSAHLHSHMSFGSLDSDVETGFTGTFATAVVGEYTMPFGLFGGVGGGWGVLNNPNGPLLEARVGYYISGAEPTVAKKRRLNVALDYRAYAVGGPYGTVNQVQLTVGYDRF